MNKKSSPFHCPVCKKAVERTAENFPFCSERCRVTDLGSWAAGDYHIAGEPAHIIHDADSEY